MKRELRKGIAFVAGVLLTLGIYAGSRPNKVAVVAVPAAPRPDVRVEESWSRQRLESALASLQEAKTKTEQVEAAIELGKIPVKEIPAALGSIPLVQGSWLTPAASTLLVRWASEDGEAALSWAWLHLRSKYAWRDALSQISAAWAWKDPAGLAKWTLAHIQSHGLKDPTLAEAEASEIPILGSEYISEVSRLLLREDPKLALQVFLKRGGFSSGDPGMWASLEDPAQIEKALQAFDNLEDLKTTHHSMSFTFSSLTYAEALLSHWLKIDPEGFKASRYKQYLHPRYLGSVNVAAEWKQVMPVEREAAATRAVNGLAEPYRAAAVGEIAKEWNASEPEACRAWLETLPQAQRLTATWNLLKEQTAQDLNETLDWIESSNPPNRPAYFVETFDEWTKAHPDETPEMEGWSEKEREMWGELEALKKVVTK